MGTRHADRPAAAGASGPEGPDGPAGPEGPDANRTSRSGREKGFWSVATVLTAVVVYAWTRISWAFTALYGEAGVLSNLVVGGAVLGLLLGGTITVGQRLLGIRRPGPVVVLTTTMLLLLGGVAVGTLGAMADH